MEFGQSFGSMTRRLVEANAFASTPFSLVDAGCSGGISPFWRIFEPTLSAVGVDPVKTETERLNSLEKNPSVSYIPAFMGLPDDHPFILRRGERAVTGRNPWDRLSAKRASDILSSRTAENEKLAVLNDWQSPEHADPIRKLHLSELASERGLDQLDFIKIDVDGHDMDVLLSAESIIKTAPVLGLTLEVDFYGSANDTDHTFHNTDRLMRSWGFELFDLTVRRYSASVLPQAFEWDCPAQTKIGRPYQGDALYLRDPCAWGYAPECKIDLSSSKMIKLASLFELFSLPDHAAELLEKFKPTLACVVTIDECLDLLAKESQPSSSTYAEHVQRFEQDPSAFYRSRLS